MKPRFIVVDGADGCGKTTFINRLQNLLESKGEKVYRTKGLGGDGKDFVQNEIRKLLLSPEFPEDETVVEEELFSLSDRKNLKRVRAALESDEYSIALQDRGKYVHCTYAQAKGMAPEQAEEIHEQLLEDYDDIADDFGALYIVMVPEDEALAMERVKARGEAITPRLENLEMQKNVIAEFNELRDEVSDSKDERFIFITVYRNESRDDVFNKIMNKFEDAGIEL
jgi:thymidylate kinase